ncbi:sensor histidine kinase [Mesobacillus subterraneus]|uniref:sensor histidine kinase n=1 Tax=Mesobacillus subterraneus TaxID=285983 RepID=UPI00204029E0|nr:sensor histidine kinase [Mesobacillus subterraneus]MCM3576251.1 sensor histidine kinase [Mesobacillus subterraneus]
MKKFLRVSLKVKILGLVILLIVFIIGALSSLFIYMKQSDDIVQAKDLSLQTAKTLSYMPALHEYYRYGNTGSNINLVIDQIKYQAAPMTVFFQHRDGKVFASTDDRNLYKNLNNNNNDKALTYGSYYVLQTTEGEREVLKAVAPVTVDYGSYKKVEGTVVVLYDMNAITLSIWQDIGKILKASIMMLLLGVIGSYLLANSIRKDTLNLEPSEIAALYRERNAILQSVKEGIVAVDGHGYITMMNASAREMFGIKERAEGTQVSHVIDSLELLEVLESQEKQLNIEIQHKDKILIVSTQPIYEGINRLGLVGSFRDRTEIKQMIDALSEVKQYSDDLRAQAHEFSNKLYGILGLLQLDKKNEAIEFIKNEAHIQTIDENLLLSKVKDEKVQAILLGKMAQASEKKISFLIDPESSLEFLPEKFKLSSLIIILGNLINNAFEAVREKDDKTVRFFVTDIGNDIIFEVLDYGAGIDEEMKPILFQTGVSSKGRNRGYGLANVIEEVETLGGMIEFSSNEGSGTFFTVYLPKG